MKKKKKEDSLGGIIFTGFLQSIFTAVMVYVGTILVTLLTVLTVGFFSRNKEEDTLE